LFGRLALQAGRRAAPPRVTKSGVARGSPEAFCLTVLRCKPAGGLLHPASPGAALDAAPFMSVHFASNGRKKGRVLRPFELGRRAESM